MLLDEAAIPSHACYNVHVRQQFVKMQCRLCVCMLIMPCMVNASMSMEMRDSCMYVHVNHE
jgi:hypothetical protein